MAQVDHLECLDRLEAEARFVLLRHMVTLHTRDACRYVCRHITLAILQRDQGV